MRCNISPALLIHDKPIIHKHIHEHLILGRFSCHLCLRVASAALYFLKNMKEGRIQTSKWVMKGSPSEVQCDSCLIARNRCYCYCCCCRNASPPPPCQRNIRNTNRQPCNSIDCQILVGCSPYDNLNTETSPITLRREAIREVRSSVH